MNDSTDTHQAAVADSRPKIRLPGDDYLLSSTAADLAAHLFDKDIYLCNGEVVVLRDGSLCPITPQEFRTWVEQYIIGYRVRQFKGTTYEVDVTMWEGDARGVLASPLFKNRLLKVSRVNTCRLPILRADGAIESLPVGYDLQSQVLTLPGGPDFDESMTPEQATSVIDHLLEEFPFADPHRSRAVVVSAMMGQFALGLLPTKSLRPCFVFLANAEGAGKTLLAQCCMVPTLGKVPTGVKAGEDSEMRKVLTTAVRAGRTLIFFDNIKGKLSSPALEAFLSSTTWDDRILGGNVWFSGDNLATVFITGNGLTVSPDMRRRSLFVELHMAEERAEDRIFKQPLDLETLLSERPRILSALSALVRYWDSRGRPRPTHSSSSFPGWANVIGGIVEAAGFGCPLETPQIDAAVDRDGDDMHRLVAAIGSNGCSVDYAGLVTKAREHGCFEHIIGPEGETNRSESSRLGWLLARYKDRQVGSFMFRIEGKGHGRRFRVEAIKEDSTQHG
ncbi:MAG: hypothetical protein HZA88_15210 [Verrucomicrobia bacterium]|nr:hypothetical protein [Verrucomicrobiota bacterium]